MYNRWHDATAFCASFDRRRAPTAGGRLALVRCPHLTPLPDSAGQRQRGTRPTDCPPLGCDEQTVRNAIRAFNRLGLSCLNKGPSRPHTIHAAFPGEKAEQLRALLHQSPRTFDQPTNLWTLELAAEVSFQQGLTPQQGSGETIRATLARLGCTGSEPKTGSPAPTQHMPEKRGPGSVDSHGS